MTNIIVADIEALLHNLKLHIENAVTALEHLITHHNKVAAVVSASMVPSIVVTATEASVAPVAVVIAPAASVAPVIASAPPPPIEVKTSV